MTKSVLAHLVGRAVRDGCAGADDAVIDHVPELARHAATTACTVLDVLTMTTGVDWVEDHRDPDSLASRLLALLRRPAATRAPCWRGRARRRRPAPAAPTAPPTRRCSTGCASGRPARLRRRRGAGSGATLGCTRDAYVAVDGAGVALAGGGLAATARDWARVALLAVGRHASPASGCSTRTWVDAARACRRTRSSPPAGCPAASPRTPASATTGGRWTTTGHRVTADGSRGQFACADRRPDAVVVKTSQWPYDDFLVDRQAATSAISGLHALAASR